MRRTLSLVAVLAALTALLPAAPAAADGVSWIPTTAAARQYADSRAGSVSFAAIGTDGRIVGHRAATRVPAASVLKVMFMTAYLRQASVRDRALTSADRALLEPMIRSSANDPATQIANRLGPGPLYALAAAAGMQDFSYTRPWGLSTTSARDQVRFLRALPDHLPARHRDYALGLLTQIVPSQRWGIGQVSTPGWSVHFKGGWGSGTGAVDHQVALLRRSDGTRVSVAVMTTGNPNHAYGTDTLREVFRRLLADLPDPNPRGAFDEASGGPGTIRVRGWAYDLDAGTRPVRVHVYVGGEAGSGATGVDAGPAQLYRPDVGRAFPGIGDHHGFDVRVATARRGRQQVCAYAIDVGPGSNRLLGCRSVTVSEPGPQCLPAATSWFRRDGVLASGTAAIWRGAERIDVFGVARSGRLYHLPWDGARWHGWLNLGHPPGVPLAGTPDAVAWRDWTVNVFARGSDQAVWQRSYAPGSGWSPWIHLGGIVQGGVAAVSPDPQRVDVFAVAGSGRLYQRTYRDRAWGPWTNRGQPPGVALTMAPGAVTRDDGAIDVFARGEDRAVWHLWYRPGRGWGTWRSLGGTVVTGPTAVSSRLGRVDVFAVSPAGRLWRRSWEGAWAPWADHGRPGGRALVGQPGAVAWAGGRVDTFPRDSAGTPWHSHNPCLR